MKRNIKLTALVLALLVTAVCFAACGGNQGGGNGNQNGGSGDATVSGTEHVWGNITVLVPDGMKVTDGSLVDKESPNSLTVADENNALKYFMVDVVDGEEYAKSSLDTTKEMNEGAEDFSFKPENSSWTGVQYKSYDVPCFQAYSIIGEKTFVVRSAGFEMDDAVVYAVLNSIK